MIYTPAQLQELVEKRIDELTYGTQPIELYEPISYIMGLGGKRLRPVLALMSYLLYKDEAKDVLDQAVAIELFHNFTLVHDDIMDEAPIRRGKPTVHEKWNANVGILSGDVMLVKVYDLLLQGKSSEDSVKVIQAFNKAAILVCEGQQWDMNFETEELVDEADYITMIRLKTAELLAFSLAMGGILAGRDDQVENLMDFGNFIGIGFQLKDDLLDAFGTEEFGKQTGGDIKSRKKTYLTIKTYELADATDKKELLHLYAEENRLDPDERVKQVLALYEKYGIKEKTESLMNEYFERGFRSLKAIDAPLNRKGVLKQFAEALIDRIR